MYPHEIGILGDTKTHFTKWWFFTQNGMTVLDYLEPYLNRFLDNKKEFLAMEAYLDGKRRAGRELLHGKEFSRSGVAELQEYFDQYFALYYDIMVIAGTLRVVDRQAVLGIRQAHPDRLMADEVIATVSVPVKLSFNMAEEEAVLQLASDVKRGTIRLGDGKYRERLKKIEDTYAWVVMGYFEEKPKNLDDYDAAVQHSLVGDPRVELENLKERVENDHRRRDECLRGLDQKTRALAGVAASAAYLKDYYKYSVNEMEYVAEPLFLELARRSGEQTSFIKDLAMKEIIGLVSGKVPDKGMVARRNERYIAVGVPQGRYSVLVGGEADDFVRKYLPATDDGKKEFHGRIASRGYGKGTVKIILSGDDFKKLEQGDILVATNTSPDFISIMRKAAAIIAEEGGITAHVSVVSRELGIPCVVGITHATDIFKDGDMVEVDANNGVVKKLS